MSLESTGTCVFAVLGASKSHNARESTAYSQAPGSLCLPLTKKTMLCRPPMASTKDLI